MIEDIEISYYGVSIRVTHSLYKPDPTKPGKIRYTFHLPTRGVVLSHEENDIEEYWHELPNLKTPLASELGKLYESFFAE